MARISAVQLRTVALAVLALWALMGMSAAYSTPADTARVVEIRSYALKPGTSERFHQLFLEQALPMLRQHKVDVVAFGPSLHDADSYFLLRAYDSLDERTRSEDAFYGSAEWKKGPREAILTLIDTYTTVVVRAGAETVQALRGLSTEPAPTGGAPPAIARATDLATLLTLNDDYIRSVQASDARRFRTLLADDFLCSMPDGSQIDRDAFLKQVAAPATMSNLQAHDVNIRLMGDFAIVHARTTFTRSDGRPGASRYTDVWVRRDGRWMAVAAHVTRY